MRVMTEDWFKWESDYSGFKREREEEFGTVSISTFLRKFAVKDSRKIGR